MSDFIFAFADSSFRPSCSDLMRIYGTRPPEVQTFSGKWGSMVASANRHNGFLPFENESHILIVVGGPILYFRDNDFLTEPDSNAASEAIYRRWVDDVAMQWDEDLSGPFSILLVNKQQSTVTVVTDLMSFIPVYKCSSDKGTLLGTHVDALARASGEADNFDEVSLADFALNDVVTYPYTVYRNIRQLPPSSIVQMSQKTVDTRQYWVPNEQNNFNDIQQAANYLRDGISGYINRVTQNMTQVAQFISAGEDSRALAGMLPPNLRRDAYIFLDRMNREGRIARKVANAYGANFEVGFRSVTHYLDILPEAATLVGSGHQYFHAHSLGFDREYSLADYTAVFGGFLSDTLQKGMHVKKFRGHGRIPFFPEVPDCNFTPCGAKFRQLGQHITLTGEVRERQEERLAEIKQLRPKSATEWYSLYPITMYGDMPNLHSTRRLFRSYEPFMCKEAVKVSAAVPTSWKLNRRLFNRAMRPYLKSSRWIFHADGRLPYFRWWQNIPPQFGIWLYRHIAKRIGLINGQQGPWGDWKALYATQKWQDAVESYSAAGKELEKRIAITPFRELLNDNAISSKHKCNLLQTIYSVSGGQISDLETGVCRSDTENAIDGV